MYKYLTIFGSKLQQAMTKEKKPKRISNQTSNPNFTSVTVKLIPKETMRHILAMQSKIKLQRCSGQYSISSTIVAMLKEHKDYFNNKQ